MFGAARGWRGTVDGEGVGGWRGRVGSCALAA